MEFDMRGVAKRGLGMTLTALSLLAWPARAQQPPQQQPPQQQAQPQAQSIWDKMPRMQLERQFAGPLQDTIVQRWRDPADGTVCYMYLPVTVQHTPPTPSGFVQYGANNTGSISCFESHAPARPARPPAAPKPN
jgi:hypothetical protein